jgi:hypothetical protein
MNTKQRMIVLLSLALLGLSAAFPPRRGVWDQTAATVGNATRIPPRAFLYGARLYHGGGLTVYELDAGRLLAEWGLILSISGICLVLLRDGR